MAESIDPSRYDARIAPDLSTSSAKVLHGFPVQLYFIRERPFPVVRDAAAVVKDALATCPPNASDLTEGFDVPKPR